MDSVRDFYISLFITEWRYVPVVERVELLKEADIYCRGEAVVKQVIAACFALSSSFLVFYILPLFLFPDVFITDQTLMTSFFKATLIIPALGGYLVIYQFIKLFFLTRLFIRKSPIVIQLFLRGQQ